MVSRVDNINLPSELEINATVIQNHIKRYVTLAKVSERWPVGKDINDFFPLVHRALYSAQLTEKIPKEKMVRFVEQDPPEEIDTETITFYIQARNPGQFSQGPAGTQSHREVGHHVRNIRNHPDFPGEKLVTLGKFYDNYIKFNIYARDNKTARKRLLWFTRVMSRYDWYFKSKGFDKVIELGVGDRKVINIDNLKVVNYPITYFVKSEDLIHTGEQEMKQIVFSTEIEDLDS